MSSPEIESPLDHPSNVSLHCPLNTTQLQMSLSHWHHICWHCISRSWYIQKGHWQPTILRNCHFHQIAYTLAPIAHYFPNLFFNIPGMESQQHRPCTWIVNDCWNDQLYHASMMNHAWHRHSSIRVSLPSTPPDACGNLLMRPRF